MGRASKLSNHQRAEILRRLALGESRRQLAKEYKVSESCIRQNLSTHPAVIEEVATNLSHAELALAALPEDARISARTLTDQLNGIGRWAAKAGEEGMRASAHLAMLMRKRAERMGLEVDTEDLRPIAALAETANKASVIGMGMMNRRKDQESTAKSLEDFIVGEAS